MKVVNSRLVAIAGQTMQGRSEVPERKSPLSVISTEGRNLELPVY